jgi:hypothetical protein
MSLSSNSGAYLRALDAVLAAWQNRTRQLFSFDNYGRRCILASRVGDRVHNLAFPTDTVDLTTRIEFHSRDMSSARTGDDPSTVRGDGDRLDAQGVSSETRSLMTRSPPITVPSYPCCPSAPAVHPE